MSQSQTKPKLIPIKVPWKVSDNPFLTLTVSEYEPRLIEFLAYYKSASEEDHERRVKVTFKSAPYIRVNPALFEGRVIDENMFDWSEVKPQFQPYENNATEKYLEEYTRIWKTTGFCPYPNFYEVENSDWLKVIPFVQERKYKHYIIPGEDMWLEILGTDFSWTAGEIIDWTKG